MPERSTAHKTNTPRRRKRGEENGTSLISCTRISDVPFSDTHAGSVTVLEEPAAVPGEAALLAEAALAADWSRPEEDAAWSHLQPEK